MREVIEVGDQVEFSRDQYRVVLRISEIAEPPYYESQIVELGFDDGSNILYADFALDWDRVRGLWVAYPKESNHGKPK